MRHSTPQKSLNISSYFLAMSSVYGARPSGSGSYSSKFRVSAGPRRCGTIGPCTLRWYNASQSICRNQGCAFTAAAPPLRLPSRLDVSTVHSLLIRSRASGDMADGKRTLPSTILGGEKSARHKLEATQNSEDHTARKSSSGFGPRKEAGQRGIRRPKFQKPTSQRRSHGLIFNQPPVKKSIDNKTLPVFLITSGARYSGVPHNVYVSPSARLAQLTEEAAMVTDCYRLSLRSRSQPA